MASERMLSRFLGAFLLLTTSVPLMAGDSNRWLFRVYLDDREIGYHEFSVTDREGGQDVEISAEFDVKILFFNAYSYDHQNLESWTGDCLARIDASTNDNGAKSAVSGQSSANGFVVNVNQDDAVVGADCVRSFAYWNPVILESETLLNAQTGELVDVVIRNHGADMVQVGSDQLPAEKYTIEMRDGPIHLWYSPGARQWLALEAATEGGRMLRYVPMVLPLSESGNARLVMD
jgi:hypothetical protein